MARPTRRGPHRRRVLGDDTRVQGEFQTIRALTPGTETIRELALVRNNEVVRTVNPATNQVEFEHTDQPSLLGGILYYARPLQTNDEIARSSPVCLILDRATQPRECVVKGVLHYGLALAQGTPAFSCRADSDTGGPGTPRSRGRG